MTRQETLKTGEECGLTGGADWLFNLNFKEQKYMFIPKLKTNKQRDKAVYVLTSFELKIITQTFFEPH